MTGGSSGSDEGRRIASALRLAEELELVNPIAGINSTVTVVAPLPSNGAEPETLAELKERVLDRIRDTPQGGAEADYIAWAKGAASGLPLSPNSSLRRSSS